MSLSTLPLLIKAAPGTLFRPSMLACLAILVGGTVCYGATSSITGFYSVAVPQGNSAWVCGLVAADDFEGDAISVAADSGDGKALVTFNAPSWTADQFVGWYAEPQSGTSAGLAIDVISNTTDTLKLEAIPASAGLSAGTAFVLRRHATLGGIMPLGGGFAPLQDSISLFDASGHQQSYMYSNVSNTWIDASLADATDVVIRPGQGFVIFASNAFTLTLGKTGIVQYVKQTPTQIKANAGVPNLAGALNPLSTATSLGALGVTGSLQAFNDSLVTLTPGTLAQGGTYLSNGTNLINGTGQSAAGTPLPAGASVVINVDAAKAVTLAPVPVSP